MHDIEVNGGLAWPDNGKILVYLGCPLDPPPRERMFGEALVGSFAAAEAWLRSRAEKDYGVSFGPPQAEPFKPVVQRLFEAGIAGSVHWVFDGAFGVTLPGHEGGASCWAEAEAWLAEYASAVLL